MLGTRLSFPGFMFLWEDLVSHQLLAWLLNLGEITGCACLSPSRARSAEPRACRVWASPSLRWACWAGSVLPQAEAMVLEDILSAWSGGAGFACLFNRNSSSFWLPDSGPCAGVAKMQDPVRLKLPGLWAAGTPKDRYNMAWPMLLVFS